MLLSFSYKVKLTVAGGEFLGQGELPQQAKHDASFKALTYVRGLPSPMEKAKSVAATVATLQSSSKAEGEASSSLTNTGGGGEKSPIMLLNEIGMSKGQTVEWMLMNESGPPHMRFYSWKVVMGGQYEAVGSGNNKKVAKTIAAQNLIASLPEEMQRPTPKKSKNMKRKLQQGATQPYMMGPPHIIMGPPHMMPPYMQAPYMRNPKRQQVKTEGGEPNKAGPQKLSAQAQQPQPAKDPSSGKMAQEVILNPNPISALHEYCKKAKIPDPEFECVSESVLETWQKGDKTFKKTEYTLRLEVNGKAYFASANTKKAAKTRVAEEAWNYIRVSMFP